MFSYYGAKRPEIIKLYPVPRFDNFIEPFAGSARYSMKYFDREVILIDKYPVIIDVWKYLQSSSPSDILKLPRLKENQTLDEFDLSKEEKLFLGFCIKGGNQSPSNKTTSRNTTHRPNIQNYRLKQISRQLFKIRHWKFICGDYDSVPNQYATWFIDPPYYKGGQVYICNNKHINYEVLGKWCNSRNGQVIVCENSSANWLPFFDLKKMRGSLKTTYEVFWTNEKVEYQTKLF